MGKSGKCSAFRWLCCGSGSVHPEPRAEAEDEIPDAPEVRDQAFHDSPELPVAAPAKKARSPVPKHAGLENCEVELNDTCRYYCPLCMMYFEAVYETLCCGHTICDECALGYMRSSSCNLNAPPNLESMEEPSESWIVGDTILLIGGISPLLPNACTHLTSSCSTITH